MICCIGDELYHIRQDKIEVASLANGPADATFVVKATIAQVGNGHYWCQCPIKLYGTELVSVLNLCKIPSGIFKFSPSKSQFSLIDNFQY